MTVISAWNKNRLVRRYHTVQPTGIDLFSPNFRLASPTTQMDDRLPQRLTPLYAINLSRFNFDSQPRCTRTPTRLRTMVTEVSTRSSPSLHRVPLLLPRPFVSRTACKPVRLQSSAASGTRPAWVHSYPNNRQLEARRPVARPCVACERESPTTTGRSNRLD